MNRIRVLKLGWEFPPLINGGLGVACLGLSQALAKHVDLRVIVPRSAPEADFDGFTLTGLNNLKVDDLKGAEGKYHYESFAEIQRVPIELDPYASDETLTTTSKIMVDAGEQVRFSQTTRNQLDQFKTGELYGSDLGTKVIEFSKVAAKMAMLLDFDVVHAHDWMTFLAGVEVKKATGKPLVIHVHASQYDRAGADARGWIFDLEKYGMEQADIIIPVSRYTGQICAGHYGADPAKIRPVHNGAEPVKVFSTKKPFPEKLVLFLGRLTAQKGPEFFLEIAAKVLEKNRNVRFVMAGTGERLKPLAESTAFRGLGGYLHFTGFLNKEKVNELLSMTDIYCMPSVSEPFGLSALEAAQFGIPAVISKQSGVAEVLKGALKADFWDVDVMAQHIIDLIEDDELRAKVVKQA
ncbi:glycosyltransferase, partial [Luteolibacter marinus]|uniref:glycosyltransferase n=1 Tax=Luteolibacter marinus TaxID=2776705 RepID=UPI001866F87E